MTRLEILNTHQRKEILGIIKNQYGADFKKNASELVMLLSSKNKIYLLSRDFEKLDDKKLRIDAAGLYFGEMMENKELRLSIEGSQIIGPLAKKNVFELDENETRTWLSGNNIAREKIKESGFVIIKNKDDFIGSGKVRGNEILNFVPKTRRIAAI